ncbi:hypothetical protein HDV05_001591 [Chytridiales sp. JEL 0842]|nr:hypothetical protein HDV05_001591 [Chytridiales sp. JEL 0842]
MDGKAQKQPKVGVTDAESQNAYISIAEGVETWETPNLMKRHTLLFPSHLEEIYAKEQYGSPNARSLTIGLAVASLSISCVFIINEIMDYRNKPDRTWALISLIANIATVTFSLSALIFVFACSEKRWEEFKSGHTRYIGVRLIFLAILTFSLRTENYLYWPDFYQLQASSVTLFVLCTTLPVGMVYSYPTFIVLVCIIVPLTIIRSIILLALPPQTPFHPIQIISSLTPFLIVYHYSVWSSFVIEGSFRRRYIKSKQAEAKLQRVEKEKKIVRDVLHIMLPASVIPRLEDSEFHFNTVTDRIENAVCIFVDLFFRKEVLKNLEPREACEVLNRAFEDYDAVLRMYPEFEKLKTVSSKVLLLAQPDMKNSEEFGQRLTNLMVDSLSVVNQNGRTSALSLGGATMVERTLKIGVAKGPVVAGIVLLHKDDRINKGSAVVLSRVPNNLPKTNTAKVGPKSPATQQIRKVLGTATIFSKTDPEPAEYTKYLQHVIELYQQYSKGELYTRLKSLLNARTLLFLDPQVEALYRKEAGRLIAINTEIHHFVTFLSMVLLFVVESLYCLVYLRGQNYTSVILCAVYTVISGVQWLMRRYWVRTYRKVFAETPAGESNLLQRTMAFLIPIFCAGRSGHLASVIPFTIFIGLLGYYSPAAVMPLAGDTFVYVAIVYVGFLDATSSSFMFRMGVGALASTLLTLELALLGRLRPMAYTRIAGALFVIGLSNYNLVASIRVGFLVRKVFFHLERQLEKEMHLSASLLRAILPQRMINTLLVDPSRMNQVDCFSHITVLFLDVEGFTNLSSSIRPDLIISILNTIFTEFDHICAHYNVEKIQTIGDAYIAGVISQSAGYTSSTLSLAVPNNCYALMDILSALSVCSVGLYMQSIMQIFQSENLFVELPQGRLRVRIGIHSGPAFGGMTGGRTKIKYELVGEAVDVAEKVQTLADPGSVWVSESTRDIVLDALRRGDAIQEPDFDMEETGKSVEVDGGETIKCYVLKEGVQA